MRFALSPYMQPQPASPPPPPPSPSPSKPGNMPMLYYGLVVVGTAAIILAIYNLIIIRWCADSHRSSQPRQGLSPPRRAGEQEAVSSQSFSQSFDNPNANLISSFKYQKGGGGAASRDHEYECAVCLSVFEEGEDVRELPRCKHSFHKSCIDMWLCTHLDCPLCRSPVEPVPVLDRLACPVRIPVARDFREGLLDPSIFTL